jgi:hypothetical protein
MREHAYSVGQSQKASGVAIDVPRSRPHANVRLGWDAEASCLEES